MDFHSRFSNKSDHNADTTCEHIKSFIRWIYEDNLFIKGCIVYDTTHECIKQ